MRTTDISSFVNQDKKVQTFDCFDWIIKNRLIKGSVLDLGTGHGKYAIACRDKGFDVTAVDGRNSRIPFNEKGIKWIVSDVMNFDVSGYTNVLYCGILYHLTLEKQLELLKRFNSDVIVVNTHFAIIENEKIVNDGFAGLLSFYSDNKYEGAIYKEGSIESLKNRPLAALNNTVSFWPTLKTLELMFNEAGYDMEMLLPEITQGRTFFVCTKK